MIYLIESPGYKEDDKGNISYFRLLKIGYTEDSGKEKRFASYKHHNPSSKVIYEIPRATEDHEKKLHYKFRDLLYWGKEWFKYSEEIIDFFKNIKSLEDLDKLPYPHTSRIKYGLAKEIVSSTIMINNIFEKQERVNRFMELMISCLGKDIEQEDIIIEYLTDNPEINQDDLKKYLLKKSGEEIIYSQDDAVNQEVSEFIKKYESYKTKLDKMRYLCECGLSRDAIEVVLRQIPDSDEIKSSYLALGPSKLRALSYNITRIRKALGIVIFSEDLLKNKVYSEFKKGDKYTLVNLKNKLSSIYSSVNYESTPKANDIEKWFNIKEFMTTMEIDGKKKRVRVRGYELLDPK